MSRITIALVALGLAAQGCIIYEEPYEDCPEDGCYVDTGVDAVTDHERPQTTEEAEPEVTVELSFTLTEGEAGDTLLTTLVADGEFDFSSIVDITFTGPITIDDMQLRDDEALIVLTIDPDAEAGEVDCFVELADGTAFIIDTTFTITAHDDGGGSGGGTGGSGGGTGDSGGTDTGCDE